MTTLSLSIVEIIVLMLGAIVLGITVHFFITSRRGLKTSAMESGRISKTLEDWKLKYFNDIELRDKQLDALQRELTEIQDNNSINLIEEEEMRRQNKKLLAELEALRKTLPVGEKIDYISQLREAQHSLIDHNERISHLLTQIEIVKETEEKQQEILKDNEELSGQITELKELLAQKDKEVNNVRQKEHLTKEMNSMLDSAYSEFNTLQSKMQKLESQVSSSRMINLEYEELKEIHHKLSREFEEQKIKLTVITADHIQSQAQVAETENKLREANFQRQQLQKRVAFLEELNNDLQAVSDTNKKLEGQLRRIGELESMLNVVSEERDQLARKKIESQ